MGKDKKDDYLSKGGKVRLYKAITLALKESAVNNDLTNLKRLVLEAADIGINLDKLHEMALKEDEANSIYLHYQDDYPPIFKIMIKEASPLAIEYILDNDFLRLPLPDVQTKVGLIHLAVQRNDADILKLIIERRPEYLSIANVNGLNPLQLADYLGHRELFDILLETGCFRVEKELRRNKISQKELDEIISKSPPQEILDIGELLEREGFSRDLDNMVIKFPNNKYQKLRFVDISMKNAHFFGIEEEKLEFIKCDLSGSSISTSYIKSNQVSFSSDTNLHNFFIISSPDIKNIMTNVQREESKLVSFIKDKKHFFSQGDLLERYSEYFDTRGTCSGLVLDFLRHNIDKKKAGKKGDYLSKFHRKLHDKSENYLNRIADLQLYNQFSKYEHIFSYNDYKDSKYYLKADERSIFCSYIDGKVINNGENLNIAMNLIDHFSKYTDYPILGLSYFNSNIKKPGHAIAMTVERDEQDNSKIIGYNLYDPSLGAGILLTKQEAAEALIEILSDTGFDEIGCFDGYKVLQEAGMLKESASSKNPNKNFRRFWEAVINEDIEGIKKYSNLDLGEHPRIMESFCRIASEKMVKNFFQNNNNIDFNKNGFAIIEQLVAANKLTKDILDLITEKGFKLHDHLKKYFIFSLSLLEKGDKKEQFDILISHKDLYLDGDKYFINIIFDKAKDYPILKKIIRKQPSFNNDQEKKKYYNNLFDGLAIMPLDGLDMIELGEESVIEYCKIIFEGDKDLLLTEGFNLFNRAMFASNMKLLFFLLEQGVPAEYEGKSALFPLLTDSSYFEDSKKKEMIYEIFSQFPGNLSAKDRLIEITYLMSCQDLAKFKEIVDSHEIDFNAIIEQDVYAIDWAKSIFSKPDIEQFTDYLIDHKIDKFSKENQKDIFITLIKQDRFEKAGMVIKALRKNLVAKDELMALIDKSITQGDQRNKAESLVKEKLKFVEKIAKGSQSPNNLNSPPKPSLGIG